MQSNSIIKLPSFKGLIGIALIASFCGQSAFAQTSSNLASFQACADISDDTARLGCYDRAIGQSSGAAQLSSPISASAGMQAAEKTKTARKRNFGLSMPSLPKFGNAGMNAEDSERKMAAKQAKEDENSVTYTLQNSVRKTDRRMRFTFENGQVWDQTETKNVFIPKDGEPVTATIRKTPFGSYLMRINENKHSVRVKRIK